MVEKRRYANGNPMFPLLLMVLALLAYISLYLLEPPDVHFYPSSGLVLLQANTSQPESPFILSHLQPDDISKLIDLYHFQFLINNYVCNHSSPLVLTLVHSATKNINKRNSIRQTWGSMMSDEFKLLFLVGDPNSKKVQQALNKENQMFKDLIQGNFQDTYKNLTYKHVMALKWTTYYCPGAKYILKTDDDVFVNTPALMDFINNTLSPFGARRLLACNVYLSARVVRSFRSKWRVSFREYNHTYYPPFCAGWVVLYSPDVVFNLYREAQQSLYFWIDDVHITGFLAEKMNYKHVALSQYVLESLPGWQDHLKFFLFGPLDISIENIYKLWNALLERSKPNLLTS